MLRSITTHLCPCKYLIKIGNCRLLRLQWIIKYHTHYPFAVLKLILINCQSWFSCIKLLSLNYKNAFVHHWNEKKNFFKFFKGSKVQSEAFSAIFFSLFRALVRITWTSDCLCVSRARSFLVHRRTCHAMLVNGKDFHVLTIMSVAACRAELCNMLTGQIIWMFTCTLFNLLSTKWLKFCLHIRHYILHFPAAVPKKRGPLPLKYRFVLLYMQRFDITIAINIESGSTIVPSSSCYGMLCGGKARASFYQLITNTLESSWKSAFHVRWCHHLYLINNLVV